MGLKPLEFADCLLDSPYFRENIHEHERELERTNEAIKGLIKECKTLLKAQESKWYLKLQAVLCRDCVLKRCLFVRSKPVCL